LPARGTIFGDDLEGEDLEAWFRSEEEGYAQLYQVGQQGYAYSYYALDQRHAFSKLPQGLRFKRACALGAARGDEVLPLLERVDQVTLIEPSETAGSVVPKEKLAPGEARGPTAAWTCPTPARIF